MDPYLARTAFTLDGTPFTWNDVRAAAVAWGDWLELEAATARARALVSAAPPAEERVNVAAREFRYARDLVSGDDMRRWLDAHEITVGEWMDHLRRQVGLTGAGGNGAGHQFAAAGERAVLVDAICGGLFDRVARTLAGRAALAAAAGEPPRRDDGAAARIAGVDDAYARVRERIATPAAIATQVGSHRLEWMAVECRIVRFPSDAAAREALLCVREDGEPLAAVAADAHVRVEDRRFLLEESGALQSTLIGAAPGELLGPLALDGKHALVEVLAKRLPDAADPTTRARAARAVLEAQTAAAVAARVRWG